MTAQEAIHTIDTAIDQLRYHGYNTSIKALQAARERFVELDAWVKKYGPSKTPDIIDNGDVNPHKLRGIPAEEDRHTIDCTCPGCSGAPDYQLSSADLDAQDEHVLNMKIAPPSGYFQVVTSMQVGDKVRRKLHEFIFLTHEGATEYVKNFCTSVGGLYAVLFVHADDTHEPIVK